MDLADILNREQITPELRATNPEKFPPPTATP
jgi:hypothetical protein